MQSLDLATLPLLKGADEPSERTVTSLFYRAGGSVEEAFKFHQGQLIQKGWKEFSGSLVASHSASGMFGKNGLRVSLTTFPDQPGKVTVTLRHHGNIDFTKLPLPTGAKPLYSGPASAIYVVDQAVEPVAIANADSLKQLGWTPYGNAGDTRWFKQKAVKLSVTTASAPAQGGKTAITFSSELMPAEIPAHPNATDLRFSNSPKRLTFEVPMNQDECVKSYRDTLSSEGWRTTMEAPVKVDGDQVLAFRNDANDMLSIAMRSGGEGRLRVGVDYQSAAEIAEMNRKLDAQAEAYKARNAVEKLEK